MCGWEEEDGMERREEEGDERKRGRDRSEDKDLII
jgi:hypothetical protein